MATTTRNTSEVLSGDGVPFAGTTSTQIREYSNFSDTVDLTNNTPSNYQTRMYGGDDVVTLSNANTGGFSNRVNGNIGNDRFTAKAGSTTRDWILGGSEDDRIDRSAAAGGASWQNGNYGNDVIIGAINGLAGAQMSILRGGADDDTIIVKGGSQHIVVGDLGKDKITLDGDGRVVLRTDNGAAVQNLNEADELINFVGGFDKAYVPGVANLADLKLLDTGGSTYMYADSFTNGTTGTRYIAKFVGKTKAQVQGYINGGNVIIGNAADTAYSLINPESFLADPNLANVFV